MKFLLLNMMEKIKYKIRLIKKTIFSLIWIFLIIVIIRLSIFDIFNIPSDSMRNTLKQKDLIITNKILYSSPLSTLLSALNIKAHPKPNDIFVFRLTTSDPSLYVKRCVGLPGEVIEITNNSVLINNVPRNDPPNVCHLYKVWYQNYDTLKVYINKAKINVSDIIQKYPGCIIINMDYYQKDILTNSAKIDSINLFIKNKISHNSISPLLVASYEKNIIPTLIPFEGMKIKLDAGSVATYNEVMKKYENVVVDQDKGIFFINKVKCDYYVFKRDYFFLMGDNRENSFDSRSFGFIPKNNIEGLVIGKL